MVGINVFVTTISAERLWEIDRPLPSQVQIGVNINLVSFDQKSEQSIEALFLFTVSYVPSIAQINIRGKAHVAGEPKEITQMVEEHKQQKPPIPVIQAISSAAIAEAILISKTLGVPPPLPPLPPPGQDAQKPSPTRYTA